MHRLKEFRKCEICNKSEWPKLYVNNISACVKCHVILDLFESLNIVFNKLQEYIYLAYRKPKRCCICNKLDKFENFIQCDSCGGFSCYTHIQKITLELKNEQEFKEARINKKEFFSNICKDCIDKVPDLILVMFLKYFELWIKEEIKDIQIKRKVNRHNIREIKSMKEMSKQFINKEKTSNGKNKNRRSNENE